MNVVLDANIIISASRFGGVPRRVLEAINKDELLGFTSATAMQETENVLLTKFKVLPSEWITISELLRNTLVVVPTHVVPEVHELRDKRDLHILAAAELCAADYIISGDKDLLALGWHKTIPIIRANDFVNAFGL
jgi:putative PIN family toxin of toxin-antitoxin system